MDPEATLRQKARELLRALHSQPGETVYLILAGAKTTKRGKVMDAIAKMNAPTTDTYRRGDYYVCAILVYRHHVIPWGIRLYVKREQGAGVSVPCSKTTGLAAQLSREFRAPAGVAVKVLIRFDADYRCHTVGKACREQRWHLASTLQGHRSLFQLSWKLKAGCYSRNLL